MLIDTHIWIWWLLGLPKLKPKYHEALSHLPAPPLLSIVSLWEISLLIERSQVVLLPTPSLWIREATQPDAVRLVQIDAAITEQLLVLPRAVSRDPADRIIAATARARDVPVLTMDRQLLRSGAIRLWDV